MQTRASKTVACALYKSLLRACNNGRNPHVFGEYIKQIEISTAESIPTTAKATRNLLRSVFQSTDTDNDSLHELFPVVRRCNELSSILHPKLQNLPQSIPIFDFSSSAALFGEEVQFHFFEPRYVQLCKDAISDDGDGLFIMRGNIESENESKCEVAVLLKIIEHKQVEFDEGPRFMVRCIGGPRVRVLKQETMKISDNVPSLERATEIEFDSDDMIQCEVLKKECLDLLVKICGVKSVLSMGSPPINPEQFSFFALPFVLAHNDVPGRLKWLKCKSTEQRLQHVMDVMRAYAASKEN